jgi:DNA-binding NarL/FixJ family response regulator
MAVAKTGADAGQWTGPLESENPGALVAAPGARKNLLEALAREELSFDAFENPDVLLAAAHKLDPSLIVLALGGATTETLSYVEPLTRRFTTAALVLVCPQIERWEVRAALTAGVAGIVLADDADAVLGPCARAVRAGQTCVPRVNWRQIEPPVLSSREKQILGLVVMGFMNGQIAEQLFLAESTVKSHLSSAFGKLGVRSRNEAVSLILDPERGLGMGILAIGGTPLGSPDEIGHS